MTTPSSNVGADASREWQPIESAPTFGELVIVFGGRHKRPAIVEADGLWWVSENCPSAAAPTHWMPLPTPPAGDLS